MRLTPISTSIDKGSAIAKITQMDQFLSTSAKSDSKYLCFVDQNPSYFLKIINETIYIAYVTSRHSIGFPLL